MTYPAWVPVPPPTAPRSRNTSTTSWETGGATRLWPAAPRGEAAQSPAPLHAALRERFWAEQQGAASYQAAAAETADPCLKELYTELAGEEEAHAWTVRGVLEGL